MRAEASRLWSFLKTRNDWVAVKELKLSYYIGEKPYYLLYIPFMVTLFKFFNSNPDDDPPFL